MRPVILMPLMLLMLPTHVGAQLVVRLEGSATAVDPAAARALAGDVRAAVRVPSSPGHRALLALHNRPQAPATVSADQSTEIAPIPTAQHARKTRISRSRRITRKPPSDISSQLLRDAARLSVKQEPVPGATRIGAGSGEGGRLYAIPATGGASGKGAGKGAQGAGSGRGDWRGGGGSGASGGGVKGSGAGGSGSFKSGGATGSGPGAGGVKGSSSGQRRGR